MQRVTTLTVHLSTLLSFSMCSGQRGQDNGRSPWRIRFASTALRSRARRHKQRRHCGGRAAIREWEQPQQRSGRQPVGRRVRPFAVRMDDIDCMLPNSVGLTSQFSAAVAISSEPGSGRSGRNSPISLLAGSAAGQQQPSSVQHCRICIAASALPSACAWRVGFLPSTRLS